MISKAQVILARAKPTHAAETTRLTLLSVRSIHIQREEAEKTQKLKKAMARLSKTVNITEEELKKQATAQAEQNRNRPSLM